MSENKYIILSDDTAESNRQFDVSKIDEEKINTIIENALKNN